MNKYLVASALALVLAGCATRPDRIDASAVSAAPYSGRSCTELVTDRAQASAELKKYSELQTGKADADFASVALFLIPLSWFSGHHAADVARWKGELAVLDQALSKQGCPAPGL